MDRQGHGHLKPTPRASGLMMPSEWSSHASCYISWPCCGTTWHGHIERTRAAYANAIRSIGRFEPVTVLATPSTISEARRTLGRSAELVEMRLDDSWIRDNGPIFVKDESGQVAMVKFGFNAWGNKVPNYKDDDLAPVILSQKLGMRRFDAPMVLEGGSISVDGEGTVLTTEQCLLNPNRNPDLDRAQIEALLCEYLGARKIIWLGNGIADDITDGHVDGVACFAAPHVVVAASTEDTSDPNYLSLRQNLERLECATDARGKSIEVIRIVQPRPREVDGLPITPGYTNHYIANGGIVAPTYGIAEDQEAIETLRRVHPDREVVGVDCRYIEIGGGAVHCITQQRPAGPTIPL